MSPDPSWHASTAELADYRSGPRGDVAAASIEAHLLVCHRCRLVLSGLALETTTDDTSRDRRERIWAVITDETERGSWLGRINAPWLRLSIGSPLLLGALAAVVSVLLAVPLLNAVDDVRSAAMTLIALAPVGPVVATLLAYRPELEPAGTLTRATPQSGLRLVLIRAAVATAFAIPAGLVASVALPLPIDLLLGWLIPAVAMCAAVLAVGTRIEPSAFAAVVVTAWAAAVLRDGRGNRALPVDTALEQLFVNRATTQFVALAILALSSVVIATGWRERIPGRFA